MFLSTDAEKVFEGVDWSFIRQNLEHIGLGLQMLHWILYLYSDPSERVRVNGTLPEKLSISNRTRQGCPLFPLIFILTLEPFILTLEQRIRFNPDIRGIALGRKEYKRVAFAENVLFLFPNRLSLF